MSLESPEPPLLIEPLRADHELEAFNCGSEDLNRFLKHFALIDHKAETDFNFDLSPTDLFHLFLPVKDIRRMLGN